MNKKAFTLLELLVAVLIITILAAIALPQYKKAVLKSRFATIKSMTRAIYDAEQRYNLAYGSYTKNWDDLDIDRSRAICTINEINTYVYCSIINKKGQNLLQYVLYTKTGKLRCDAYPADPNNLTNKICQEEMNRTTPNYCSTANNFCAYYN